MKIHDLMKHFIQFETMEEIVITDLNGVDNHILKPNGSQLYKDTINKIHDREVFTFWIEPIIMTSVVINIKITYVLYIEIR